jgi:hypothetical protein
MFGAAHEDDKQFAGGEALVLVVSSLGVAQTAHDRGEARNLGYPLHFASSDFTSYYIPDSDAALVIKAVNSSFWVVISKSVSHVNSGCGSSRRR